jgi:O-methyltransferase
MLQRKFRPLVGRLLALAADRRICKLARDVVEARLTYLSLAKFYRIEKYVRRVISKNVEGDILEFGVALGGSAIVLASEASKAGRKFYGFDVFGMIPEPTSEKDDEKSKARYRVIASGQSEGIAGDAYYGYRENLLDEVKRSFARYGLPIDGHSRSLCKGLFRDTLPRHSGKVAFAHVDCDWYDPVKLCLEEISKRMSKGGVIILDDYYDYGGARAATDEFLKNNPEFRFLSGPNAVLVKR